MIKDTVKIGKLESHGRIVFPPVATYKCDNQGSITDELIEYYHQRAMNPNISIIITEHSYIDRKGMGNKNQMSIADDSKIEGLKKLVGAIHTEGKLVIAQINHAGASSKRADIETEPIAPSAFVHPLFPRMGDDIPAKAMSKEDIANVIKKFAEAARRAKEAGYDGVEIHSAHAYLLDQFYSPLTNKREDEYGGSLENRLHIHREIIRAVRAEVGSDFIVGLRLGGIDDREDGNQITDAVEASKILAAEGIDYLSLSGGMCGYIRKDHNEPGYFGDMSKAVKENVHIPVLLTGGVKTLAEAEQLLEDGTADLIGVARAIFADPNWEM